MKYFIDNNLLTAKGNLKRTASAEDKTKWYKLKLRQKHGEAISLQGNYTRSKDKHTFSCINGHTWSATFDSVVRLSGCPHCSKNAPTSEEDMLRELHGTHKGKITLVSPYTSMSKKHTLRCNSGHTWESSLTHVINKMRGCARCSGVAKKSQQEAEQDIADLGAGVLLTDIYKGSNSKHKFTCSKGHKFNSVYYHIIGGSGCPICANREHNTLYLWKAEKYNNAYKVGITSTHRGLKRIRECASIQDTEYTLIIKEQVKNPRNLERIILNKFKKHPEIVSGDGYTEFIMLNNQDILTLKTIVEKYIHEEKR